MSRQLRYSDHADELREQSDSGVIAVGAAHQMQMGQVVLAQGGELDLCEIVGGVGGDGAVLDPVFDAGQVVDQRIAVAREVSSAHGHEKAEHQDQ